MFIPIYHQKNNQGCQKKSEIVKSFFIIFLFTMEQWNNATYKSNF